MERHEAKTQNHQRWLAMVAIVEKLPAGTSPQPGSNEFIIAALSFLSPHEVLSV
jgi:hypothetical protein